jgi:hypothetical protein
MRKKRRYRGQVPKEKLQNLHIPCMKYETVRLPNRRDLKACGIQFARGQVVNVGVYRC